MTKAILEFARLRPTGMLLILLLMVPLLAIPMTEAWVPRNLPWKSEAIGYTDRKGDYWRAGTISAEVQWVEYNRVLKITVRWDISWSVWVGTSTYPRISASYCYGNWVWPSCISKSSADLRSPSGELVFILRPNADQLSRGVEINAGIAFTVNFLSLASGNVSWRL